jgi:hypothetical protein
MKKMYLLVLLVLALFGCNNSPTYQTRPASNQNTIQPTDFNLGMVSGLIKNGAVDGPSLETQINDPSKGINNINTVRGNQTTDYVKVVESNDNGQKVFTYVAQPQNGNDMAFAVSKFSQNPDSTINIQSGFLPVVPNYNNYTYQDSFASNLAFATWLYTPRPIYIGYLPRTYIYHQRMSSGAFITTSQTYQTQSRISPVRSQPAPANFNASNYASKTIAAAPRPASNSLSQSGSGMKSFSASNNTSKPAAVGFGATPSKSPSVSSPSRSSGSVSRGRSR